MTNYWIFPLWLTIHSPLLCRLLLAHCQYLHRFNIVRVDHPTVLTERGKEISGNEFVRSFAGCSLVRSSRETREIGSFVVRNDSFTNERQQRDSLSLSLSLSLSRFPLSSEWFPIEKLFWLVSQSVRVVDPVDRKVASKFNEARAKN